MKRTSNSGFNLVEMAIALVIVAIGIMSVVGIFPNQLDAVRKTQTRAQMNQFAQSVEAFFRAASATGVDVAAIPGLPANQIVLPPVGGAASPEGGLWIDATSSTMAFLKLDGTATSAPHKIYFADVDAGSSINANYVNQAMWYKIQVQDLPNGDLKGKQVIIEIWPGDATTAPTTPAVGRYITEIYE